MADLRARRLALCPHFSEPDHSDSCSSGWHLSQSDLARMVGVSHSTVWRIEAGKIKPRLLTQLALEKALRSLERKAQKGAAHADHA